MRAVVAIELGREKSGPPPTQKEGAQHKEVVRVHIDREKIKLLWNCVLRKDAGNVGLKEEMAMEVD